MYTQEKKLYSLAQQESIEKCRQEPQLLAFWEKLKRVTQMDLYAKSRSTHETGWNGKGKGEVVVTREGDTALIFQEKGSWQPQGMAFSNTFRWRLDRLAGMISLDHLRLGPNSPVFLFHLTPTSSNTLASVDAHLCKKDIYSAQVLWDRYSIRLNWRVIGPHKNEEMEYTYS